MKKILITVLLLIAGVASAIQAGEKINFEISPVLLFNSGKTDYTINAATLEVSEDLLDTTLVGIRSKLEFPLDGPLAGFELVIRDARPDKKCWTINLCALMNISDPDEIMLDHDWFIYPEESTDLKFSYTESPAKVDYLLLNLEISKVIARREKFQLDVLVGLRYNKIDWKITGFDGWMLDDDGIRRDISGTEKALTYEATYTIPQVGFRMSLMPSSLKLFTLQTTIGRLMASDFDDHLLRGKTAEASTTGWAFLARAGGRILLAKHGSVRPFFTGQFEYTRHTASGSQTQTWYQDEEYTDENGETQVWPAGSTIPGIPYETSTYQMRYGVGFGISF